MDDKHFDKFKLFSKEGKFLFDIFKKSLEIPMNEPELIHCEQQIKNTFHAELKYGVLEDFHKFVSYGKFFQQVNCLAEGLPINFHRLYPSHQKELRKLADKLISQRRDSPEKTLTGKDCEKCDRLVKEILKIKSDNENQIKKINEDYHDEKLKLKEECLGLKEKIKELETSRELLKRELEKAEHTHKEIIEALRAEIELQVKLEKQLSEYECLKDKKIEETKEMKNELGSKETKFNRVSNFLQSYEQELKALEKGMKASNEEEDRLRSDKKPE